MHIVTYIIVIDSIHVLLEFTKKDDFYVEIFKSMLWFLVYMMKGAIAVF